MTRNERLRYAVLNFLAPRQVAAFDAGQIAKRLAVEGDLDEPATEKEVFVVCEFLHGAGLADALPDPMGATIYWRATSKGVIESERWRAAKGLV
jgi:hypothetical protein